MITIIEFQVLFVAFTYLLFVITPFKNRLFLLMVCSLLYYYISEPRFLWLFLVVIFVTYLFPIITNRLHGKFKSIFFSFSIVAVLSIYLPFKFSIIYGFFANKESFILPLGLSFFVFQALSYMVDVYNNRIEVEKNFIDYAFYLSFFPQLICGPIERYEKINPQIDLVKITSKENIAQAFIFIFSGLIKKYIFADRLSIISVTYDNHTQLSGVEWLLISFLTRYQIYLDLSGYTDVALGIGKLFGFEFTNNFDKPFKAKTIDEFWRRWHITLSNWIRDYVFYPLATYGTSMVSVYCTIIFSFMVLGLWHGDTLNFLAYGILNGMAVVATLVCVKLFSNYNVPRIAKVFGYVFSFVFFMCLPTVLLRSHDLTSGFVILSKVFDYENFFNVSYYSKFLWSNLKALVVFIVLFELIPTLAKIAKFKISYLEKNAWVSIVMASLMIIMFFAFYSDEIGSFPFIYEKL